MLSAISSVLTSLVNFFSFLYTFVTTGLYSLIDWSWTEFYNEVCILVNYLVSFFLNYAWQNIYSLINNFNSEAIIASAWSKLDHNLLFILELLQIPTAISLLLSAYFTRYIIRWIPFSPK